MPNWSEVLGEISKVNQQGVYALDGVRRKYLKLVNKHTGRNVIAYYSGWLQRGEYSAIEVNDRDISGFMLNIHKLDRSKGLDIILHTPGGDIAATESLVSYLRSMFGNDIRAIVPQLSMSAGSMIALSCNSIIMGKHSSLGPIDPQMGGIPCQAVIAEFETAKMEILADPNTANLWQFIINKYHPTFLSSCQHAIDMSKQLVQDWLESNMCKGEPKKATIILDYFASHDNSKSHSRHIPIQKCKDLGVTIIDLEEDDKLQDLVLTTHHAFMHTFSNTGALKIIENHNGVAFVENIPHANPAGV
ncbi:MAG: S49 family peptidase [Bacteroidetes bacterium]|nr:S49 family peptidase [Bacteroidota bacterium]